MTQFRILENNKLIGIYDGWVVSKDHRQPPHDSSKFWIHPERSSYLTDKAIIASTVEQFKYHLSFDWLMQVVEKIESTKEYVVRISRMGTAIFDCRGIETVGICDVMNIYDNYKKTIYIAVVLFVKWYNLNHVPASESATT